MKGTFYSPDPNEKIPEGIEEIISSAPINAGWLTRLFSGPMPLRSCQPHRTFLVPADIEKIICLGVINPFAYRSESQECVEIYSNENVNAALRREKDFVYHMPDGCKVAIILLEETVGLYRPLHPRVDPTKLSPPSGRSPISHR